MELLTDIHDLGQFVSHVRTFCFLNSSLVIGR